TPVAAGNDVFPPGTLDHYFGDYYREMGLSRTEFLGLGRVQPADESEPFSMTLLPLRLCAASNAVSELHGTIAWRMGHHVQPDRPGQFGFAGKAHPHDEGGKELIRELIQIACQPESRARLVFLGDHDLHVARRLVQGVDVWLNTPRRPLEASGTSGMKAIGNGALNISILDGWWDEAYSPGTGWAIGQGEEYEDDEYRDRVEAGALLDLLENEVVPLFYQRGPDNVPPGWMALMRTAITTLCAVFNTNRMVYEHVVPGYSRADERRARPE